MSERIRDNASPTAGGSPASSGRIPDELVDRFFDRELDEGSRERFFGMLRADLSRCAEVAKTQRIVSMLREPIEAPDLTVPILAGIRQRRGFLPERLRRMVKAGRLGIAACLLVGVLGFALGRRYAPDFFRLAPEAQPVSAVIKSGTSEAAAAAIKINPQGLMSRPIAITVSPGRRLNMLAPGKTSVVLLPKSPAEGRMVVYGGAGPDARFVVENGVCVDRVSACALPLLTSGPAVVVVEEWVRILKAEPCEPGSPVEAGSAKAILPQVGGVRR